MWRSLGLLVVGGAALTGCGQTYDANPISQKDIGAVVSEIKWEVGKYQQASLYYHNNRNVDPAFLDESGKPLGPFVCGNKNNAINFYISKVGMKLTSITDNTGKGNLSIIFPIAPAATFTPGFSYSQEKASTEKISFVEYPILPKPGEVSVEYTPGEQLPPIAQTLFNLRGALIQGALSGPCFTAKPGPPGPHNVPFDLHIDLNHQLGIPDVMMAVKKPVAKPGASGGAAAGTPTPAAPVGGAEDKSKDMTADTITLGITVTKISDASIKISAAIVTAGAEGTAKSVSGNTITVTFTPTNDADFLLAK